MAESIDFSQLIPIFPLPSAVMMPRAIFPLHIFEHRYREMTSDALAGSRLMAIALLKPGFEALYHTVDVEIHPVVCVGRILREEKLPDGRFNMLLQGLCRAHVIGEDASYGYRRGFMQPILSVFPQPEIQGAIRRKIRDLLSDPLLVNLATKANWLDVLKCPDFSLSDIVDVLASVALPCSEEKQRFLAEPSVLTRAKCLMHVLQTIGQPYRSRPRQFSPARAWPPPIYDN